MSPAHLATALAITAGFFTLSVVAGRWTWRGFLWLRGELRAERERRLAHEQWLAEKARRSTPGSSYTKQLRPPFNVQ